MRTADSDSETNDLLAGERREGRYTLEQATLPSIDRFLPFGDAGSTVGVLSDAAILRLAHCFRHLIEEMQRALVCEDGAIVKTTDSVDHLLGTSSSIRG